MLAAAPAAAVRVLALMVAIASVCLSSCKLQLARPVLSLSVLQLLCRLGVYLGLYGSNRVKQTA